MGIQGKTAFITGAARGIGEEIALSFARAGTNLFLTYANTPLDKTIELASATGVKVETAKADVSDSEQVNSAVKKCIEIFGGIDILVNNAGVTKDSLLLRMKDDDWEKVLDVNLKGAFNTIRAATKTMIKKRAGKIINIGSVVGSTGNAGQANYASSKAGLEGLTKSVARELASRNIQANLIAPGYIETEMTAAMDEKTQKAILANIPLKKLGKPSHVADAALFLASSGADYITGQVLHINGGLYM